MELSPLVAVCVSTRITQLTTGAVTRRVRVLYENSVVWNSSPKAYINVVQDKLSPFSQRLACMNVRMTRTVHRSEMICTQTVYSKLIGTNQYNKDTSYVTNAISDENNIASIR